jgi:hypothetical protein
MTPGEAAQRYAVRGWPVFPCCPVGRRRKQPLTSRGFYDASADPDIIAGWWTRWPNALVGLPTGRRSGVAVLDIDVKDPKANGFDTLEERGLLPLPTTPMVHTASGGMHVYFAAGDRELRNSASQIGAGVDVRGEGGYVIVPSPGSGYWWDPHHHFGILAPVPAPAWLWPAAPANPSPSALPIRPSRFLTPYAEAALSAACRAITNAPAGEQERTLNAEVFSIATFAATRGIPADLARRVLHWAASQMPNYNPRRPWRAAELARKVDRAFDDGLRHPREARRA